MAGGANAHTTVLPSSTELFYFYRQTLEQCARLSNRGPFKDLCAVFAKYLRAYADEVLRAGLTRYVKASECLLKPSTSDSSLSLLQA